MFTKLSTIICAAVLLALAPLSASFAADSGFYAGGSVGTAAVELDLFDDLDGPVTIPAFDEDDFAWKAFAGYTFPIPVLDIGIEGGYVDFGGPSVDFADEDLGVSANLGIDTTAFDVFGVVGIGLGPLDIFGKVGLVYWDAELSVSAFDTNDPGNNLSDSTSDDGSDMAYGIGARLNLGKLEIRGEYEIFDIDPGDDVDVDLSMLSVGLVWHFN